MRAGFIAALGLGACGPSVAVNDGGEPHTVTSDASATRTSGPDEATSVGVTGELDSTSTAAETDSTGADDDAIDGACPCPEPTPVGLDDNLRTGFTPAHALAALTDIETPFVWDAYEGGPETVLHLTTEYAGGSIVEEPGGECGSFISIPCGEGVRMEVVATLTTDDGWLAATFPATLTGVLGDRLTLHAHTPLPIDGNDGVLADQPLTLRDEPQMVLSLEFLARHRPAIDPAFFIVVAAEVTGSGAGALLGHNDL